ncbi:MAG: hypothetical protein AAF677_02680 [Pseudomonadota bacterium]
MTSDSSRVAETMLPEAMPEGVRSVLIGHFLMEPDAAADVYRAVRLALLRDLDQRRGADERDRATHG